MKTELTLALERELWVHTHKKGTFGCYEVTIGWFGKERVDYISYNTKGEFRCYEIKVTRTDFRSKSAATFIGHYNYYVLTAELYDEVKDEIPKEIGVYVGGRGIVRRAKRQELKVSETVLMGSMIRSLCREFQKQMDSDNLIHVDSCKKKIAELKSEVEFYKKLHYGMEEAVANRFGWDWHDAPEVYDKYGRKIAHREE